jgi:acetyl esterase/lipase
MGRLLQSIAVPLLFLLSSCARAQPAPAQPVPATQPAPFQLPPGVRLVPNIEYARPDGHSLLMDLYLPEQATIDHPIPVIVWIHGGGWVMGDRHDHFAAPLAEHGYAVASIEYRLAQVATFPAQIEDCKAAVRWLRSKAKLYNLDSAHIGAWGGSAGGHLSALLGVSGEVKELEGTEGNLDYSSRVQAVCDWCGPSDFTTIIEQSKHMQVTSGIQWEAPDSFGAKLIGGAIPKNLAKAKAASPITYVSKDSPPFLIMHGDRDPLVPLAQSEELLDALQKAGVQAKLVVIPGAGHIFWSPQIMHTVEEFFDKELKPEGSGNGNK